MIIPNAELAVIDDKKLLGYSLSLTHPEGKHKARVFLSALGITAQHADILKSHLLDSIKVGEAELGAKDQYGVRYQLDLEMTTAVGSAIIRSGWIIRVGEEFPRLVTCYVPDKKESKDANP